MLKYDTFLQYKWWKSSHAKSTNEEKIFVLIHNISKRIYPLKKFARDLTYYFQFKQILPTSPNHLYIYITFNGIGIGHHKLKIVEVISNPSTIMSPAFAEIFKLDDIYKSMYPKKWNLNPMKAKSLRQSWKIQIILLAHYTQTHKRNLNFLGELMHNKTRMCMYCFYSDRIYMKSVHSTRFPVIISMCVFFFSDHHC